MSNILDSVWRRFERELIRRERIRLIKKGVIKPSCRVGKVLANGKP